MMERLENPDKEELNEYDVSEETLEQVEKETTFWVDKGQKVVHLYSGIGSHIRKIISSPNPKVDITNVALVDGDISHVRANIPIDSITVSIKKSPKKQGYLSQMLLS